MLNFMTDGSQSIIVTEYSYEAFNSNYAKPLLNVRKDEADHFDDGNDQRTKSNCAKMVSRSKNEMH